MRKMMVPAVLGSGLLAMAGTMAFAGNGTPINTGSANVLTLAVYGDAPYGINPTDTSETLATPAFVDMINGDPKVDLVLHVGDIHSGKQFCTEDYDRTIFGLWSAYKDPVIYTPGDNEWTDCNKAGEGGGTYNKTTKQIDYVMNGNQLADYAGGDPIANLDLIRSIFFANPGVSLGGRKKQVLTQAQSFDSAFPTDAKYVENVMWEESKVLFVTINLPGGSNNDNDVWYAAPTQSAAQSSEIVERTGADLRWLDAAFAQAAADGVEAVVIGAQADMWDPEKLAVHQAAFEPFVASIASHTLAFGGPVLMFNGDSHVYRSENPLVPPPAPPATLPYGDRYFMHPFYNVPNFHRVVVHGSTFPLEYLRLTVDPRANYATTDTTFGPFSWEHVVLP
jgi:hypothetical protein